jgi:hypothetical protein
MAQKTPTTVVYLTVGFAVLVFLDERDRRRVLFSVVSGYGFRAPLRGPGMTVVHPPQPSC